MRPGLGEAASRRAHWLPVGTRTAQRFARRVVDANRQWPRGQQDLPADAFAASAAGPADSGLRRTRDARRRTGPSGSVPRPAESAAKAGDDFPGIWSSSPVGYTPGPVPAVRAEQQVEPAPDRHPPSILVPRDRTAEPTATAGRAAAQPRLTPEIPPGVAFAGTSRALDDASAGEPATIPGAQTGHQNRGDQNRGDQNSGDRTRTTEAAGRAGPSPTHEIGEPPHRTDAWRAPEPTGAATGGEPPWNTGPIGNAFWEQLAAPQSLPGFELRALPVGAADPDDVPARSGNGFTDRDPIVAPARPPSWDARKRDTPPGELTRTQVDRLAVKVEDRIRDRERRERERRGYS
jgi:hypothetical protein